MGIIDLYSGELTQYKQGQHRLILFMKGIRRCCGSILPIGILESAGCDVIHQELQPEDRVVMVSDGALGDEDEMQEIISTLKTDDCKETLDRIVSQVLFRCKGKLEDDVTVIVAKLEIA